MLRRFRLSLLPGMKHYSLIGVALLAMLSPVTPVNAAIIVNDTWLDGTDDDPASPVYSEYGVDSDSDGNLETPGTKAALAHSIQWRRRPGARRPYRRRSIFGFLDDLLHARRNSNYSRKHRRLLESHLGLQADQHQRE